MKTKVEPAVLKHVSFSEAPSQTSSADSSAPQASVNQVETDIKKMNIKDPGEGSSVPRHLNERPTNQDPCESGYFLKTSERCKKAPYRGLLNQGATCFLNAALQVLFMTQEFRDRVLRAPRSTSERLESALKKLFEELSHQDPDAPSVSTKGVIQALGIERVYEQQDAVEYFLDILEKVGFNLAEVFRGTMRNLRRCSRNHESYDDSDFKSIQISLNTRDGPYTLENGVESYFASTKLVGDDQMYCEECDEKSDTIWSCEISEYPAVLALHLKRFVYDYCSNRFVKNHCPMDVPLQLRLQQEYWLYAVVNHRGSRYGGHYTADILAPEDNKWFCFDDSRVTETNESKLKGSREAYLLLYQKTYSPAGYETRKDTLRSQADSTDPRTGQLMKLTELTKQTVLTKLTEPTEPMALTETIEPTKLTELTKLTEPTESMVLTVPIEPTKLTVLTKPTEPTALTETTEPMALTEPTESTKLTVLTESTALTEPTEPMALTKPTELTEPTALTEPTEPTKQTVLTKLTEPTEPMALTKTIEPTKLTELTKLTYPTESMALTEPIEPTKLTVLTKPTEPTALTETTEPMALTEPTEPTKLTEPMELTEPKALKEPTDPMALTEPIEPTKLTVLIKITESTVLTELTEPTEPMALTPLTEPTKLMELTELALCESGTASPAGSRKCSEGHSASSVERVEDVEEAQMKSEAETSRAEERGGAHDKKDLKDWMCFSVSAVTRRLRILVLSRTESHKNTVEEMILRHAGFSSQPQLYCDESLKDSLEVCRPGPHVILWVTPLEMNQKDIQAFKKVYRFLGRTARRYIMIVFISEGRPSESSKNTTRKYRPIKNSLVLDISAHLSDQAKNLFYKLKKTAYKNPRMPYYDNKPRKVRHKKTKKKKHERERARKSKLRSNHGERERRKQS
ncbi:uncharacterized protein LOC122327913 isoform X2 [Puntigrus tetrazona]|uniref:uncharacterized protein LOC122327913 isoform X2 n=1 Tax=Puntigrus tetrazona TaxID=1606681 RepID=UPI001C89ABCE|nr:uncharacterized protein LOC122327913 isoform X2 [Puntigrus tetrazona]